MAGKRKTPKKDTARPEGFDVVIGYIKDFEYYSDQADHMNGHPKIGRVYRLIKDDSGYRLHIGRENNTLGLDGLYLGPELSGSQKSFRFDIEVLTPTNYLSFDLVNEDGEKVVEWLESENKDLWEILMLQSEGALKRINDVQDLRELMEAVGKVSKELEQPVHDITSEVEIGDDPDAEEIHMSLRLDKALHNIYRKDYELMKVIVDVMEYISSTYGDKYENAELPNLSKEILINTGVLGKGANVFNVFKYVQRYATTGFKKSDNVQDLYKALHYTMFELQRRKNMSIEPNKEITE